MKNRCILAAIFVVMVLTAMAASFPIDSACAQTRYEPRIEGVSYRQLAEWDSIYGMGRFYGGYWMPGYGPFLFQAPDSYTKGRRNCTPPLLPGPLW